MERDNKFGRGKNLTQDIFYFISVQFMTVRQACTADLLFLFLLGLIAVAL